MNFLFVSDNWVLCFWISSEWPKRFHFEHFLISLSLLIFPSLPRSFCSSNSKNFKKHWIIEGFFEKLIYNRQWLILFFSIFLLFFLTEINPRPHWLPHLHFFLTIYFSSLFRTIKLFLPPQIHLSLDKPWRRDI